MLCNLMITSTYLGYKRPRIAKVYVVKQWRNILWTNKTEALHTRNISMEITQMFHWYNTIGLKD